MTKLKFDYMSREYYDESNIFPSTFDTLSKPIQKGLENNPDLIKYFQDDVVALLTGGKYAKQTRIFTSDCTEGNSYFYQGITIKIQKSYAEFITGILADQDGTEYGEHTIPLEIINKYTQKLK
ncbi:MAG: hypothetical protein GY828_02005 [Candidatus Gracilibacteria bacterium]|nr:hypothetical protein [Candidatus Gracilibacteria bacterium]